MPAVTGKDGQILKNKYAAFVGKMTGPKTEAALAKVLSIGVTGAKELAPLEYGTLINSAFRRIYPAGNNKLRGVAGFTVYYAYYLHEKTNWRPRPPSKKSGPAWNPGATPKFLEIGFTSSEQRELMQKALGDTYKL